VASAAPVAADPVAVVAVVGVRGQHRSQTPFRDPNGTPNGLDDPGHDELAPSASLAIAYRLPLDRTVDIAVGVRVSLSHMRWEHRDYNSMGFDHAEVTHRWPLDVGVTAQFSRGRWWIAPWLGVQSTRETLSLLSPREDEPTPYNGHAFRTYTFNELGFGATAGIDVIRTRGGNISAALDVEGAEPSGTSGLGYWAIGAGVAYRR